MFTFNNNKSGFKYFPFFHQHYWKTPGGQLSFISTNSTITPALTVSGGPTPVWHITESTGKTFKYEAASFSHTKTAGTGNLTVRLVNTEAVKSYVTGINFVSDGIFTSYRYLNLDKYANINFLALSANPFAEDFSAFKISPNLEELFLRDCFITGSGASWGWQNSLITVTAYGNTLSDFPLPTYGTSFLANYFVQNNAASQAAVDAVVLALYNNRNNYTYATPALNIGGTNSAPSGIYQNASPPTTGKEYIYKLVNDPDLEGFNKWTITYTA